MRPSSIQLDRRFAKKATGFFERYTFDVGVLKDGPRKLAANKSQTSTLAGKTIRKKKRGLSEVSLAESSEGLREFLGINFYTKPFRSAKNRDILRFSKEFFKLFSRSDARVKRRAENMLQAIVRNPFTRGDYGSNGPAAIKRKGFDWLGVDTGQLFQGIRAKVNEVRRRV